MNPLALSSPVAGLSSGASTGRAASTGGIVDESASLPFTRALDAARAAGAPRPQTPPERSSTDSESRLPSGSRPDTARAEHTRPEEAAPRDEDAARAERPAHASGSPGPSRRAPGESGQGPRTGSTTPSDTAHRAGAAGAGKAPRADGLGTDGPASDADTDAAALQLAGAGPAAVGDAATAVPADAAAAAVLASAAARHPAHQLAPGSDDSPSAAIGARTGVRRAGAQREGTTPGTAESIAGAATETTDGHRRAASLAGGLGAALDSKAEAAAGVAPGGAATPSPPAGIAAGEGVRGAGADALVNALAAPGTWTSTAGHVTASGTGALDGGAEASVAAPPGSAAFAQEVGARLSFFVRDGIEQARLQLHPADLGPVLVRIQLEGQAAQVHMAADLPGTRAALEQALPALAGQLAEQGFTLAGGGVFDRSASDFGREQREAAEGARTGGAAGVEGAARVSSAGAAVGTAAWSRPRGIVDLVA